MEQGIVTEVSDKAIELLKSKGWKYITATRDVHNEASGKDVEKLGMQYKYSYEEQWQPNNITVTGWDFTSFRFNHSRADCTHHYLLSKS